VEGLSGERRSKEESPGTWVSLREVRDGQPLTRSRVTKRRPCSRRIEPYGLLEPSAVAWGATSPPRLGGQEPPPATRCGSGRAGTPRPRACREARQEARGACLPFGRSSVMDISQVRRGGWRVGPYAGHNRGAPRLPGVGGEVAAPAPPTPSGPHCQLVARRDSACLPRPSRIAGLAHALPQPRR
jgi:hypothetical protein